MATKTAAKKRRGEAPAQYRSAASRSRPNPDHGRGRGRRRFLSITPTRMRPYAITRSR
jgi:hypothetical protein